jgi:hypothetical protein
MAKLLVHGEYDMNLDDIVAQYSNVESAVQGFVPLGSAQQREKTDGQLLVVSDPVLSDPPLRPSHEVLPAQGKDGSQVPEESIATAPESGKSEGKSDSQTNLESDAEKALRKCVSESNGLIRAAFAIMPGDNACLGYSNCGRIGTGQAGPPLVDLFRSLSPWGDAYAIGDVDELRVIGRDGMALMVSDHGVKAMAILEGKASLPLARLRLIKAIRTIAGP